MPPPSGAIAQSGTIELFGATLDRSTGSARWRLDGDSIFALKRFFWLTDSLVSIMALFAGDGGPEPPRPEHEKR
jgi:hypothetical protein